MWMVRNFWGISYHRHTIDQHTIDTEEREEGRQAGYGSGQ
jgi:hypothetical protein